MPEEKTFKSTCCFCKKPFHIRAEPQDPEAEGTCSVAVECPYCGKNVMVELPRIYREPSEGVMMLRSIPAGEGSRE